MLRYLFYFILPLLDFEPAYAAAAGAVDGSTLSLWWGLPFAGILLSLAFFPLFASKFWHAHYGKISVFWAFTLIIPLVLIQGRENAYLEIMTTLLDHYVPFVVLLGALFTISGGVKIHLRAHGTPAVNTGILALGAVLAGWIGTTGAAMLLIRPMLHINRWRSCQKHQVIFFIFLVANIGGSATPLGDPPLFLGFLNGVEFGWTLQHLIPETIAMAVPLLAMFYLLDKYWLKKELKKDPMPQKDAGDFRIDGKRNFWLLLAVIGFVLMSGIWKSGVYVNVLGIELKLQNIIRDVALIGLIGVSMWITPREVRKDNHFSWEPFLEVFKLFFAIFITAIPVILILDSGESGSLSWLVGLVSHNGVPNNDMYFWLTGLLSGFLDNAPTYLVFFHVAGGDAQVLMNELALTLEAISLGAVFMGAMTYIGNAPNFMVKAIAERHNVDMPSFFAYVGWSVVFLVPLFILLTIFHFN